MTGKEFVDLKTRTRQNDGVAPLNETVVCKKEKVVLKIRNMRFFS